MFHDDGNALLCPNRIINEDPFKGLCYETEDFDTGKARLHCLRTSMVFTLRNGEKGFSNEHPF